MHILMHIHISYTMLNNIFAYLNRIFNTTVRDYQRPPEMSFRLSFCRALAEPTLRLRVMMPQSTQN
jgi:hypothetical protein